MVSIAAFAHPGSMMRRHLEARHIPPFIASWVLRYVQWRIGQSLDEIGPVATIRRASAPVLLLHGTGDETIPLADARAVVGAADPDAPVSLLEVEVDAHKARRVVAGLEPRLMAFIRGVAPPADDAERNTVAVVA